MRGLKSVDRLSSTQVEAVSARGINIATNRFTAGSRNIHHCCGSGFLPKAVEEASVIRVRRSPGRCQETSCYIPRRQLPKSGGCSDNAGSRGPLWSGVCSYWSEYVTSSSATDPILGSDRCLRFTRARSLCLDPHSPQGPTRPLCSLRSLAGLEVGSHQRGLPQLAAVSSSGRSRSWGWR